uniref:Uncharacterized protein n=1 Tax=Tetranychus urticae TaxID=32264 RepID=T1JWE1_TETUR
MDLDRSENDHNGKKLVTLSNEHKGEIEARAESFNAADDAEKMLMLTSFWYNCEKLRAKAGERNNVSAGFRQMMILELHLVVESRAKADERKECFCRIQTAV